MRSPGRAVGTAARQVRSWAAAGERGSIAPAIPIFALVLLLLGGLVIDASRQLNARGQAVAFAEEAARAGAQAVVLNEQGETQLVGSEVPGLVQTYCAQILTLPGVDGCALTALEPAAEGSTRPLVVVTRVEMSIPASLLGMVGVRTLSASAQGRAEPVRGEEITGDDDEQP